MYKIKKYDRFEKQDTINKQDLLSWIEEMMSHQYSRDDKYFNGVESGLNKVFEKLTGTPVDGDPDIEG